MSVFLRDVVGNYMTDLGKADEKVLVVNADLMGTCRNKEFCQTFPNRAFNVGIAEQQLVSFSAGLAVEGFKPYAFTMAPFMSMRACEQVRTDVAYGNRNVKLMSVYSGLSGGISGPTHWGMEDCGIMRSIANMTIVEPCDAIEAKALMDYSLKYEKPMYFRITTEKVNEIYSDKDTFELGRAKIPVNGKDAAIICSGVTVQFAIDASRRLSNEYGLSVKVVDMHTIKPIDKSAVIEAAKTGAVIVAQDHNVIGGLGTAVAEVLAEYGYSPDFKILGIPDTYGVIGHAGYLYGKYGYDTNGIVQAVLACTRR